MIDEIIEVIFNGSKTKIGRWDWSRKYKIRIGDHETELTEEQYGDMPATGGIAYKRWWVFARDTQDVLKKGERKVKNRWQD